MQYITCNEILVTTCLIDCQLSPAMKCQLPQAIYQGRVLGGAGVGSCPPLTIAEKPPLYGSTLWSSQFSSQANLPAWGRDTVPYPFYAQQLRSSSAFSSQNLTPSPSHQPNTDSAPTIPQPQPSFPSHTKWPRASISPGHQTER